MVLVQWFMKFYALKIHYVRLWPIPTRPHPFYSFIFKVKYTDGPCGKPKLWIWSLAFQKYTDGPSVVVVRTL
ncbi:hypothetical protein Hanom_Chr04g00349201 [Helianthus anomalus]